MTKKTGSKTHQRHFGTDLKEKHGTSSDVSPFLSLLIFRPSSLTVWFPRQLAQLVWSFCNFIDDPVSPQWVRLRRELADPTTLRLTSLYLPIGGYANGIGNG